MKKYVLALVVLAALCVGLGRTTGLSHFTRAPAAQTQSAPSAHAEPIEAVVAAFSEQASGTQVTGEGVVTRILADDANGSRHQRFIVTLPSGQTLLIAHNIDLAPRLASLKTGDSVTFHGVYEWNEKGGVIHWTHRDPSGHHEAGWLRHAGQTYD
ncbi:MAG: DUF3465 domain-containing protein [Pseudomonadota bacterium]|nr:DUF3465 domain-containing protein [Pseudomonadota bacterium]